MHTSCNLSAVNRLYYLLSVNWLGHLTAASFECFHLVFNCDSVLYLWPRALLSVCYSSRRYEGASSLGDPHYSGPQGKTLLSTGNTDIVYSLWLDLLDKYNIDCCFVQIYILLKYNSILWLKLHNLGFSRPPLLYHTHTLSLTFISISLFPVIQLLLLLLSLSLSVCVCVCVCVNVCRYLSFLIRHRKPP